MIKLGNDRYILHFVELGDYGDLYIGYRTHKQAKKRQQELIDEHDKKNGYFTEILKIISIRRKEPDEKEQTKYFKLNGNGDVKK